MNKLQDEIYEAINAGVHKALVLPDEYDDNDISVKFHHKKISSNVDIFDTLVKNLYDGQVPDYSELEEYCNRNNRMYTPNDIHELNRFYLRFRRIPYFVDTSKSLKVIDYNYKELSIRNFLNEHSMGHYLILMAPELVTADEDNTIIMSSHKITCETTWCKELNYYYNSADYIWPYNSKDDILKNMDYSGWTNTYRNNYNNNIKYRMNKDKKPHFGNYMAFRHCGTHNNQYFDCYLPAIGQLMIINECAELINYVFKNIFNITYNGLATYINGSLVGGWWSSTDCEYNKAWLLRDGEIKKTNKDNKRHVLPLFKKIKES